MVSEDLMERVKDLESLDLIGGTPRGEDLEIIFLRIMDDSKRLMENAIVYENHAEMCDDQDLHYSARLRVMFEAFDRDIYESLKKICSAGRTRQIMAQMDELRGMAVPNSLSPVLMKSLVCEEIDEVESTCIDLVRETHYFAKQFVRKIVDMTANAYPRFQAVYKKKLESALHNSLQNCLHYVKKVLQKERSGMYTINRDYLNDFVDMKNELEAKLKQRHKSGLVADHEDDEVDEYSIDFEEVTGRAYLSDGYYQYAFLMKMSLAAYWKVVNKRMVDEIAFEIHLSLETAILTDHRTDILKEMVRKDTGKDVAAIKAKVVALRAKEAALKMEHAALLLESEELMKRLKTPFKQRKLVFRL